MLYVHFDLETIPQQPEDEVRAKIAETIEPPGSMTKPETIKEWMDGTGKYVGVREGLIDEGYRKTSLNGAKGSICSVAWAFNDSECINNVMAIPDGLTEAELLATFFESIRSELGGTITPYFCGHAIGKFDLFMLYQRAVIRRQRPGFYIPTDGRHSQHYFDTMTAWAGYNGYVKLNDICAATGIPCPLETDGSEIWDLYKAGKYAEIGLKNIDDVDRTRKVFRRLAFAQ